MSNYPSASAPVIPTTWQDFPAYRLANDHLEAVVVPALARVMHFGRPGGRNWMWTNPTCPATYQKNPSGGGWANWGGDNTWLSPQSEWPVLAGQAWPPDPAWGDPLAAPHHAEILSNGGLRVTGPVSAVSGMRLSRDYHLDGREWVTIQSVENVSGPPLTCGLWSITDIARPDAAYFVPSPAGCQLLSGDRLPELTLTGGLIVGNSTASHQHKFGIGSPVAAIAARFGNELLVQRAEHPPGDYPDGGVSVEYYDHGSASPHPFAELELLGPLVTLHRNQGTSLTMRWNIETLAVPPDSAAALSQIHASLHRPT